WRPLEANLESPTSTQICLRNHKAALARAIQLAQLATLAQQQQQQQQQQQLHEQQQGNISPIASHNSPRPLPAN
ncbi:MAG: hypothetical protein N6V41_01450, partial [Candidatus Portiera aleyrodidarum]|nr:hypothetical protein [Candidatus Portiera aleyrodidarum]